MSFASTAFALPDLIVWGPAVVPEIVTQTFTTNDCSTLECITPGTHKLLKFDTQTRNIGTTDLILGNPATNSLFHYDPCHGHHHLDGYADYRLRNSNGVVSVGNKIGFCLLDSFRWDTTNGNANSAYDCGFQGIQKGWGDIYTSGLSCQWINITGLAAGVYTLELEVNPDHVLIESDYSNNLTSVSVTIPSCRAITMNTTSINDASSGNGNGSVDPGEIVSENILLLNTGCTATNVVGLLTTATPGITILQGASAYPDIPNGVSATNSTPFTYRVAKSVPCGTAILFTHVAVTGGEVFSNQFVRFVGQDSSATNTFTSADVPQAITDLATIFSTNLVSLPGSNLVQSVTVSVRLNHTYDGDLVVALQHPDGTEVVLSSTRGGSGNDFGSGQNSCSPTAFTVFRDSASTAVSNGVPPFTASAFRPETPLGAFNGKPANGAWRLRVFDTADADTGTLGCWKLTLTTAQSQFNCNPFNHLPVASNANWSVTGSTTNLVLLTAGDDDAEPLFFLTNSAPDFGLLSGFAPLTGQLSYTPAHAFAGVDSFTFAVSDGVVTSAPATITLNVSPPSDTNSNGLPDAWESAHTISDPNADPDGDGQTNLQEYWAGTNPNDGQSWLRVTTLAPAGAGCALTWASVGGVRYRVHFSNGDANGNFNGVFSPVIRPVAQEMDASAPGTPGTLSFTDNYTLTGGAPGQGRRYYRVEAVR